MAYFRISTIDDAVTAVMERTKTFGRRDRYWTIRNNIVSAYEEYHSRFRLYETLSYDQSVTWTSGRKHDISATLTDWRGEPLIITSADEDEPWERLTPADIMQRRGEYDAGDTGLAYLDGSGAGFVYAPVGDYLISVATKTNVVLTVTHFAQPTALTPDVAGTTTFTFPLQFTPLIVLQAILKETVDMLNSTALRNKEQRQYYAVEIQRLQTEIGNMEKDLEKDLRINPAVKHTTMPGPYAEMLSNMSNNWDRGGGGTQGMSDWQFHRWEG